MNRLESLLSIALLGLAAAAGSGELEPVAPSVPAGISATTLSGADWRLGDQRGRVVLLNFWAGWCPSCLGEMPALNRLAERLAGRSAVLVGINVGEPQARVRTLVTQYAIGFPVLLDPDQRDFTGWGATVLPTTYVLDRQGRLRLVGRGPLDWDDPALTEQVTGLIDEAADTAGATVRPPPAHTKP